MILIDTSVWVDHFRKGNRELERLLNDGDVVCHPFVIGELACGNLKNRKEIISLLQALSTIDTVDNDEIIFFIEKHKLKGKGVGLIDVHLLASAILNDILLWTFDRKLKSAASKLNIEYIY